MAMNTSAGGDELQQLLLQQAEIQAKIASLLPSTNSSQHYRSPIHKQQQQHRRSNVPRTIPPTGSAMARHLSSVGNPWFTFPVLV